MVDDLKPTLGIFAEAVRELLRDAELAYADPAERAIVARLARLVEGKYPGWSIDLEWSRREDVIKRLRYGLSDDELIGKDAIVPDLIIHRVGKQENLLCQTARNIAPRSASNLDPLRVETVRRRRGGAGLGCAAAPAPDRRRRVAQSLFLKRQLSLPVSTMSQ